MDRTLICLLVFKFISIALAVCNVAFIFAFKSLASEEAGFLYGGFGAQFLFNIMWLIRFAIGDGMDLFANLMWAFFVFLLIIPGAVFRAMELYGTGKFAILLYVFPFLSAFVLLLDAVKTFGMLRVDDEEDI